MSSETESALAPFELTVDQLLARKSNKWNRFPPDVLAAWIADMDFVVAEPVQRAIARFVEQRDYGYADRLGQDSLATAFAEHMQRSFGWQPDPGLVRPVAELIQGMFAVIMAFSEPGDGVVVQTPIYPPFLMAIDQTGRRLVENRLRDSGQRFELDLDDLKRRIDQRTRILLFCNPHNPTGRVFSREELEAVAQLALERELLIVSDEIHADLVYPGREHLPMALLGPEVAARTVTLTSATKGFNIPGLRCALLHFGSAALWEQFHRVFPERVLGQVNPIGIDATVAAWRHGQPWLATVRQTLLANRERLLQRLTDELPEILAYRPEGSYLAWLDCRALPLPAPPFEFFLDRARVGFSDGAEFGPPGQGCVRLNFATSGQILDQMVDRMVAAVGEVRTA